MVVYPLVRCPRCKALHLITVPNPKGKEAESAVCGKCGQVLIRGQRRKPFCAFLIDEEALTATKRK